MSGCTINKDFIKEYHVVIHIAACSVNLMQGFLQNAWFYQVKCVYLVIPDAM